MPRLSFRSENLVFDTASSVILLLLYVFFMQSSLLFLQLIKSTAIGLNPDPDVLFTHPLPHTHTYILWREWYHKTTKHSDLNIVLSSILVRRTASNYVTLGPIDLSFQYQARIQNFFQGGGGPTLTYNWNCTNMKNNYFFHFL